MQHAQQAAWHLAIIALLCTTLLPAPADALKNPLRVFHKHAKTVTRCGIVHDDEEYRIGQAAVKAVKAQVRAVASVSEQQNLSQC